MKKIYNQKDYKIFLDNDYIKNFLNTNIKKYWPGFVKCLKVESKYFKVLAATSFLVRYIITLKTKHGHTWINRMRGNRLSPNSYKILKYLWTKNGYRRYFFPRPLYYFEGKQFILYENYDGIIYRDFHKKSKYFFINTIPLVAKGLAIIHRAPKNLAQKMTLKKEYEYLDEVLYKIKKHYRQYYPTAARAMNLVKKYIARHYNPKDFTLIHNDFQASNLIYNRYSKNLGIIDYEMFTQFFPAEDIATFITHLKVMIKDLFSEKVITNFQKKFIGEYGKNTNQRRLAKIKSGLPYFEIRSYLDIIAVSAVYLSLTRARRQKISFSQTLKYLEQQVDDLLNSLPQ